MMSELLSQKWLVSTWDWSQAPSGELILLPVSINATLMPKSVNCIGTKPQRCLELSTTTERHWWNISFPKWAYVLAVRTSDARHNSWHWRRELGENSSHLDWFQWQEFHFHSGKISYSPQNLTSHCFPQSPGDLWYFPPGLPHSLQATADDPAGSEFLLVCASLSECLNPGFNVVDSHPKVFPSGTFSEDSTFMVRSAHPEPMSC